MTIKTTNRLTLRRGLLHVAANIIGGLVVGTPVTLAAMTCTPMESEAFSKLIFLFIFQMLALAFWCIFHIGTEKAYEHQDR